MVQAQVNSLILFIPSLYFAVLLRKLKFHIYTKPNNLYQSNFHNYIKMYHFRFGITVKLCFVVTQPPTKAD